MGWIRNIFSMSNTYAAIRRGARLALIHTGDGDSPEQHVIREYTTQEKRAFYYSWAYVYEWQPAYFDILDALIRSYRPTWLEASYLEGFVAVCDSSDSEIKLSKARSSAVFWRFAMNGKRAFSQGFFDAKEIFTSLELSGKD